MSIENTPPANRESSLISGIWAVINDIEHPHPESAQYIPRINVASKLRTLLMAAGYEWHQQPSSLIIKQITPPANSGNGQNEPDWKAIALELARKVNFAMRYLHAKGSGTIYNVNTGGNPQHWLDYMADGLEMIPGLTVDREVMHANQLPKRERDKFFKERAKTQTDEPSSSTSHAAPAFPTEPIQPKETE